MNGEAVRSTGMVLPSSSCPSPSGTSETYIAPRIVFTLIWAPLSVPNWESVLTWKPTFTESPSSSMVLTLPTRTPAMRTSSLTLRPPASLKEA